MRSGRLMSVGFLAIVVAAVACRASTGVADECAVPATAAARLLVFTRTTGYRHESIPAAVEAVRRIATQRGWSVDAIETPGTFTDSTLARYAAVVFLLTTGDVLDPAGERAFERYIRNGGGYVGVHSAADTEYDWAWYGRLVAAYFRQHAAIQPATVTVTNRVHASVSCRSAPFTRTDEWYDFRAAPEGVTVLLTVDESTYQGGTMGAPHPLAWYHAFDGGRAWYTAMGHTTESWSDAVFLDHLAAGLEWAVRR